MKPLQHKSDHQIFRTSSSTYYSTARFLPFFIKRDIEKLYSFLRVAYDLVGRVPQDKETFKNLVSRWEHYRKLPMTDLKHSSKDALNVRVVKNMCQLVIIHQIEQDWVDQFLETLRSDLKNKRTFKNTDDVMQYVQGSGEMVGLMVARIFGLPKDMYETARLQGRVMQMVNFVRDLADDTSMGRNYFAAKELKDFKLSKLTEKEALAHPEEFKKFVRAYLKRCKDWQYQADKGIYDLPRRLRVPVQTAADNYRWVTRRIYRDPFIVFKKQLKPSRSRVQMTALTHLLD